MYVLLPKKGNLREGGNCRKITLISHCSKILLKITQWRLENILEGEMPEEQTGKASGKTGSAEAKFATSDGS